MHIYTRISSFLCFALVIAGCTATLSTLKPFASDGCSLFPDASLMSGKEWGTCCFEHDIAYWKGGTFAERLKADQALKTCVLTETENPNFSSLMYAGVRAGGSPYFYNWYRWGYGWGYERKYQALTEDELELAHTLFEEYRAKHALEEEKNH